MKAQQSILGHEICFMTFVDEKSIDKFRQNIYIYALLDGFMVYNERTSFYRQAK